MNRAFIYFIVQCFQLCHVDGVGVFTACSYIGNLAGEITVSDRYCTRSGQESAEHGIFFGNAFAEFRFCLISRFFLICISFIRLIGRLLRFVVLLLCLYLFR